MVCSLPGSSVHRISQARILEWVAVSLSGNLPVSGIEPKYPTLAGRFFTTETLGKPKVLDNPFQTPGSCRWPLRFSLVLIPLTSATSSLLALPGILVLRSKKPWDEGFINLPFSACTPLRPGLPTLLCSNILELTLPPLPFGWPASWHGFYYLVCFHEHLAGQGGTACIPPKPEHSCKALESIHQTQQIDFMVGNCKADTEMNKPSAHPFKMVLTVYSFSH